MSKPPVVHASLLVIHGQRVPAFIQVHLASDGLAVGVLDPDLYVLDRLAQAHGRAVRDVNRPNAAAADQQQEEQGDDQPVLPHLRAELVPQFAFRACWSIHGSVGV